MTASNGARALRGAGRLTAARRGQVIPIVAIWMVVIVSMIGLAIDGGRLYWEHRVVRNAADHSALAAAWARCKGADPQAAGKAAGARNGFTTTAVTITDLGSGAFRAVVTSTIPATFAAIMGVNGITTDGTAVARCRNTSGEGFALFAGGDNCRAEGKAQIDFSGQSNVITGAVHSNDNVKLSGGDNEFAGAMTYVSDIDISGSDNTFTPAHTTSTRKDWPVTFNRDDYRQLAQSGQPNMYYRNGDIDWAYITDAGRGDGLYYATGKIDVSGSGPRTLNVTLVAEKEVIIGGSNLTLNPYLHNLLAFSAVDVQPLKDRCSKEGVKMSGGTNAWKGFIYAPMSQIIMDGSSNSTLVGSLIGWSIRLSGSTLNNSADPSFFAGPRILELVE